jgi:hypothetical protein
MSAASDRETPIAGIAVSGSIDCGSTIHWIIRSTAFGTDPAISCRRAMPASGGPTWTSEPVTPGMTWHALQANW